MKYLIALLLWCLSTSNTRLLSWQHYWGGGVHTHHSFAAADPTPRPSLIPTQQPSVRCPTSQPSRQPTSRPSQQPTGQPTAFPGAKPTSQPTRQPTSQPSRQPTQQPTCRPSHLPTSQPSRQPTRIPTSQPTRQPTRQPSSQPSGKPTLQPSQPTGQPTQQPTERPSRQPTLQPSKPSSQPTSQPSRQPTSRPSIICRPGYACPDPYTQGTRCRAGQYSTGGPGALCNNCPAGYRCPMIDQAVLIPCTAGTFSAGTQSNCTMCTSGNYCPYTDRAIQYPCAVGTYSLYGQTACTLCPAGQFCTLKGVNNVCPAGSFTIEGDGNANALGLGNVCNQCQSGYYCPYTNARLMLACADGYYSGVSATACKKCPAGYACPSRYGNGTMTMCPQGTFSTGAQTSCTVCAPGFFCPSTSSSTAYACASGYYSSGGQKACSQCTAGNYCGAQVRRAPFRWRTGHEKCYVGDPFDPPILSDPFPGDRSDAVHARPLRPHRGRHRVYRSVARLLRERFSSHGAGLVRGGELLVRGRQRLRPVRRWVLLPGGVDGARAAYRPLPAGHVVRSGAQVRVPRGHLRRGAGGADAGRGLPGLPGGVHVPAVPGRSHDDADAGEFTVRPRVLLPRRVGVRRVPRWHVQPSDGANLLGHLLDVSPRVLLPVRRHRHAGAVPARVLLPGRHVDVRSVPLPAGHVQWLPGSVPRVAVHAVPRGGVLRRRHQQRVAVPRRHLQPLRRGPVHVQLPHVPRRLHLWVRRPHGRDHPLQQGLLLPSGHRRVQRARAALSRRHVL